jgi:hypothetical protein
MPRSVITNCFLAAILALTACNSNKPKPVSDTVGKSTVTVNGKKDSVIINSKKDYGNATVSDPCVKCLVSIIQNDQHYKATAGKLPATSVKYLVNWLTSDKTDTTGNRGATNSISVCVVDKTKNDQKILGYIYDNAASKLYFVNLLGKNDKIELKTDSVTLKRIRNSCYWGVASGK